MYMTQKHIPQDLMNKDTMNVRLKIPQEQKIN